MSVFKIPSPKLLQRLNQSQKLTTLTKGIMVAAGASLVGIFIYLTTFFNAASATGTMFCIWALLASSGTTPPYCSCTGWPAMILLSIWPSRHTATAVSSQEDSMPSIMVEWLIS